MARSANAAIRPVSPSWRLIDFPVVAARTGPFTSAPTPLDLPPGIPVGDNVAGLSLIGDLAGKPIVSNPPAVMARNPDPPRHEPIRVSGGVQMAKLVKQVLPVYPPMARTMRISGVVHLIGIIAKDGTIRNLQLISGHPMLTRAALEAVARWVYQPTLLSGEPVEVICPIDVNFTLSP